MSVIYTVSVKYDNEEENILTLKAQATVAPISLFNSIFNMLFDDEFYFIDNIVLTNKKGEGIDRNKRKFFTYNIKKS
jgi:hypothetical protein